MSEVLVQSQRNTSDILWIEVLDHEEIRSHKQRERNLPPKGPEHFTYAQAIGYLEAKPDGYGFVFPLHGDVSVERHKQHLRTSAMRAGLKIDIEDYDAQHLLIVTRDTGRTAPHEPVMLTPQEVYNLRGKKSRPEALPGYGGEDYRAYVSFLMDEMVRAEATGSGLLYPINNTPLNRQQIRLHTEAHLIGIKIRTSRWDEKHLLIEWRGYVNG